VAFAGDFDPFFEKFLDFLKGDPFVERRFVHGVGTNWDNLWDNLGQIGTLGKTIGRTKLGQIGGM
jgi:hypothetical protein